MQRREFLWSSAALAAGVMWPARRVTAAFTPSPDNGWRLFEVTHRIEMLQPEGATRVWLPLPSVQEEGWIRTMGNLWQGNALTRACCAIRSTGAEMLYAEWRRTRPVAQVTTVSPPATAPSTSNAPSGPRRVARRPSALYQGDQDAAHRRHRPDTAREITRAPGPTRPRRTPLPVGGRQNTFRNPKRAAAGSRHPLSCSNRAISPASARPQRTLCRTRARGRPAGARRLRHPRRRFALLVYKSLGKSGDISRAQHCRAEVWLDATAGSRSTPPTCARSCSRSRRKPRLDDPKVTDVGGACSVPGK